MNTTDTQLKPRIKVIGVGGAGGNAIDNLIAHFPDNVDDFIACNTDAQALSKCKAKIKIQLGERCTKGLGAGANPEVGSAAAQETMDEILEHVKGADMVFITAGMGGGTGTGAAPEIAETLKSMGILVVGIVTKPFLFEGSDRMRVANAGIERMKSSTDTNLIISNQNLFRIADQNTSVLDAFQMADDVLCSGVRTFIDLITKHGLINLDFADVSTAMRQMVGSAVMGTGEATGESRAIEAAEIAIACPLLNDTSIKGARCILINIAGGSDLKLFEIDAAVNFITSIAGDAKVIFGTVFDNDLQGKIRVSFVATGIIDESAKKTVANDVSYDEIELSANDKVAMEDESPFELKFENVPESVHDDEYEVVHKKLSFFDKLMGKKPATEVKKGKNDNSVPNFLKED